MQNNGLIFQKLLLIIFFSIKICLRFMFKRWGRVEKWAEILTTLMSHVNPLTFGRIFIFKKGEFN